MTSKHTIQSPDGTIIHYHSIGRGPGLIIVHGALSEGTEYLELATACSTDFTVYLIDRRGREEKEASVPYSIEAECEDILAVQRATGAKFLFGHSYGGLIALELLKRQHPFAAAAVYEPGLVPAQSWEWIDAYENSLEQGRLRWAFTYFVMGMGYTPLSTLPKALAFCILGIAVHGENWNKKKRLLHSNLREHKEVKRLSGGGEQYKSVTTPLLLLAGDKSPEKVKDTIELLSRVTTNGIVRLIPGEDHFAPENDGAPMKVAAALKDYLAHL